MALPKDETPLEEWFDDLLFTGAYCSGKKGFEAEGKRVLDARSATGTALQARNGKRDAVVLASVAAQIAWEGLREPLESLERQVDAHFDKDRKGYAAAIPLTVAVLMATPASQRAATFKPVVAFASRRGHQGKLADAAKAFLEAWGQCEQTAKALEEAQAALDEGVAKVGELKHQGNIVVREVDGKTRTVFASDPKQQRRFFRTKGTGPVDWEKEAKRLEAIAAKAVAAAKEAREKAEAAKAAKAKGKGTGRGESSEGLDGEPNAGEGEPTTQAIQRVRG